MFHISAPGDKDQDAFAALFVSQSVRSRSRDIDASRYLSHINEIIAPIIRCLNEVCTSIIRRYICLDYRDFLDKIEVLRTHSFKAVVMV